jgi:hypothetical protein
MDYTFVSRLSTTLAAYVVLKRQAVSSFWDNEGGKPPNSTTGA